MPRKRGYRKPRGGYRRRKTNYRRRRYRRKYRKKMTGMGTPSGMPLTRIAKLRYCLETGFTSTNGTFLLHQFSANDCHDPDFTSVGHQPMGWDQWKALYNHYVVVGSKMTIYGKAADTNTKSLTCGVFLDDDYTSSYSNISGMIEARKGSFTKIGLPSGGAVMKKLTCGFSAKKYFNVANIKDNFLRLGANTGVSPAETASYNFWYQTEDQSTTASIRAIVIIDYVVLFSEPKSIAQS